MDKYIEQCEELSLTARMAVALKVFQIYCKNRGIENQLVTDFFAYLWKWPLIDGSDQFEPWEQSRTYLVNFGLGDPANDEIETLLSEHGIEEYEFRDIVSSVVEILWGSFWGACEDELSLQALACVINRCKVENPPSLTPFKFSRFSDMSGWGNKITTLDCEYWKGCV